MKYLSTLGPANTFSELAAESYLEKTGDASGLKLFPNIKKTFHAVGTECDRGILPIENLVEGYVQPVLDLLLHSKLKIVYELILPIHFSFVANCAGLEAVRRVYAQFVTQGQCNDFLDTIEGAEIITTHSNGTSLEMVLNGGKHDGAIVPAHTIKENAFPLYIKNVNDFKNNLTRFIVIATDEVFYNPRFAYKTSLIIVDRQDKPGLLSKILSAFAERDINLLSIMSRPTKECLGRYHFFIDIEGHIRAPHITEALQVIEEQNEVINLGSYLRA